MSSAAEMVLDEAANETALGWNDVLPFVRGVADSLECGVMIIEGDRIVVASAGLAATFGLSPEFIAGMAPDAFIAHTMGLVDQAPDILVRGHLLPEGNQIICEEFEITRPTRSVVRWVARRLNRPRPATVVVCTDITAEVDLTQAYEKLAITDRLTGLSNRRGAEIVLKREVTRARRYGSILSLVLFDIDHFKALNDVHGHAFGDLVLRHVARTIGALPRDSDVAARWGGEEFLLILPATNLAGARVCAERVRAAVEALTFPKGGPVTVSAGVAEFEGKEDLETVLRRADDNMYAAKRAGRNRVV